MILPKKHPGPFLLPKDIDIDSFSQQNDENLLKLKNCLNFSGLLHVGSSLVDTTQICVWQIFI